MMDPLLERYWLFAAVCAVLALLTLRLVLREYLTLQSALAWMALLVIAGLACVLPGVDTWIAHRMGFQIVANWIFSMAFLALAILHLLALVALSRIELRSVALTQDVALLQEQLDRLALQRESRDSKV